MNTDNMQLVGETIDFGPCAFMDRFHPDKVFSSIDEFGRYAWSRQPDIAGWNLARLAETLLPLFDAKEEGAIAAAEHLLEEFGDVFRRDYAAVFSAKLGLDVDAANGVFIEETLAAMADGGVDFTLFFRQLTQVADGADGTTLLELFADRNAGEAWLSQWRRLWDELPDKEAGLLRMKRANPVYIPRNHRIEQAIKAANGGDFKPLHALVDLLAQPLEEQPGRERYELAPEPFEEVKQTFCGT